MGRNVIYEIVLLCNEDHVKTLRRPCNWFPYGGCTFDATCLMLSLRQHDTKLTLRVHRQLRNLGLLARAAADTTNRQSLVSNQHNSLSSCKFPLRVNRCRGSELLARVLADVCSGDCYICTTSLAPSLRARHPSTTARKAVPSTCVPTPASLPSKKQAYGMSSRNLQDMMEKVCC